MKSTVKKRSKKGIVIIIIVIFIIATVIVGLTLSGKTKAKPEVVTVSTLERIINISELSTFTAVYNGVAQVMNEKKADETDYYVAYDAKVNAGIDIEKIKISVDSKEKIVNIYIPEVYITEVEVDISSLDFIFYNKKANSSTIIETAFKACEDDVRTESEQQEAIYELAQQNAKNILTALTKPIIEQLDPEYTLVIE